MTASHFTRRCQIRDAGESDAKAISELVVAVAREHIAPTLSPVGAAHLLAEMNESSIVALFQRGLQFFAAEVDGILAGVAAVQPPAHLYYLFVRTECQHHGLGRLLWSHARDWILRQQPSATISVNASLNAVAAYRKFGFEPVGCVTKLNEVRYQPMDWFRPKA